MPFIFESLNVKDEHMVALARHMFHHPEHRHSKPSPARPSDARFQKAVLEGGWPWAGRMFLLGEQLEGNAMSYGDPSFQKGIPRVS